MICKFACVNNYSFENSDYVFINGYKDKIKFTNYSVPFNLRLFKDEYGCYLNMNHETKSKEEVKNYFDKLCNTLSEYKFNYYEIDTDDDLKDIKYSSSVKLEKIIRLVSIKIDKRFKNQNLKLGVIT